MESFKLKSNFFDPQRGRLVAATPEEERRQSLLQQLIHQLSFPKQLIAVEKQIGELPHLKGRSGIPKRRVDILCFAGGIHPLLLIECKEGDVTAADEQQVLGYNHYIQAPFVAVAGKDGARLIFPQRVPFIPSYPQLMERFSAPRS